MTCSVRDCATVRWDLNVSRIENKGTCGCWGRRVLVMAGLGAGSERTPRGGEAHLALTGKYLSNNVSYSRQIHQCSFMRVFLAAGTNGECFPFSPLFSAPCTPWACGSEVRGEVALGPPAQPSWLSSRQGEALPCQVQGSKSRAPGSWAWPSNCPAVWPLGSHCPMVACDLELISVLAYLMAVTL